MKKLLTLLGSIGMVAATAATVVACNKNKEPDKKPHLNTIIKKTDLGLINDRTPELIRAAIKAQNDQSVTDVIAKKLVITPNTNAEVMDAKVTSPDFSESVNVTYSIDPNSRIQNLNALKAKIGEANKLITSELEDNNPQAVQDLRDAIKIADAVDKESQAKAAQGVLEIAINAFNKAITQLETANLNALKAKIDEANKLITSELEDNNPQAVHNLKEAIGIAQKVDKESQAKAAQDVLEKAINDFENEILTPETANSDALKAKIDEANELITPELEDNNPQAVKNLKDAIGIAQKVGKESQAKAAQDVLEKAINDFENEILTPETANSDALKAKIDEANELITPELEDDNPQAVKNLKDAIGIAQKVGKESQAKAAQDVLEKAINDFENEILTPETANLNALGAKIGEANKLITPALEDNNPQAVHNLKEAIGIAQKVNKESKAKAAQDVLEKAIDAFKNEIKTPETANLNALGAKIGEANKLITPALEDNNPQAVHNLKEAIGIAQKVNKESKAKAAQDVLEKAINDFENEILTPETANSDALKAKIDEANELITPKLEDNNPQAVHNLKEAIGIAQKVNNESKAKAAQGILDKAINTFKNAIKTPETANLTDLKAKISAAQAQIINDLKNTHPKAVEKLEQAIQKAQDVKLEGPAKAATDQLDKAIKAFKNEIKTPEIENLNALEAKILAAQAEITNDLKDTHPKAVEKFEQAIQKAQDVKLEGQAKAATDQLDQAIKAFKEEIKTPETKINLSDIKGLQLDLGPIANVNHETIKQAFLDKNKNLKEFANLDISNFDVKRNPSGSETIIRIKGNNPRYEGSVRVTFTTNSIGE